MNPDTAFFRRGTVAALTVLAAAWVVYLLAAAALAEWLGARFGPQIISVSKGRILYPVEFAAGRGAEAIMLLTVLVALALAGRAMHRIVLRRVEPPWQWLPSSVVWLAVVNIFLWVAGGTALWWMVLYAANPNLQQPAFHMERIFLEESRAPNRLVVLGSSQGGSEIHTGELSLYGAPELRAANLSYAGATAADFLLIREHYRRIDPQYVVVYLSPLNFYAGVTGSRWLPLLTSAGLSTFRDTEVWELAEKPRLRQGVLGLGLPMFQQRMALQHAVFGGISVRGYIRPADRPGRGSAAGEDNVRTPGTGGEGAAGGEMPPVGPVAVDSAVQREAATFVVDTPGAAFLKRSMERYLLEEASRGLRIVVIDGQVNPLLSAALDSAVHADFEAFIDHLAGIHENVTVIRDELPSHSADEYVDLYHISGPARSDFTRALGDVLALRLGLPVTTEGR